VKINTEVLSLSTLIDIVRSVYPDPVLDTEHIHIVGGSPRNSYTIKSDGISISESTGDILRAWRYAVDRILRSGNDSQD
jgi:hypothetical protein